MPTSSTSTRCSSGAFAVILVLLLALAYQNMTFLLYRRDVTRHKGGRGSEDAEVGFIVAKQCDLSANTSGRGNYCRLTLE